MTEKQTTLIQTEVPLALLTQAQDLVAAGWFRNVDELVLDALRRFLESHRAELMEKFIHHHDQTRPPVIANRYAVGCHGGLRQRRPGGSGRGRGHRRAAAGHARPNAYPSAHGHAATHRNSPAHRYHCTYRGTNNDLPANSHRNVKGDAAAIGDATASRDVGANRDGG